MPDPIMLKVTYDDDRPDQLLTAQDILSWRPWNLEDRLKLSKVAEGMQRRLSTYHEGCFCDIELAKREETGRAA